jgi:hypothetical protein
MATNSPMLPQQLWSLLKPPQQTALLQLLSDLIARHLLPTPCKEVTNDAP